MSAPSGLRGVFRVHTNTDGTGWLIARDSFGNWLHVLRASACNFNQTVTTLEATLNAFDPPKEQVPLRAVEGGLRPGEPAPPRRGRPRKPALFLLLHRTEERD